MRKIIFIFATLFFLASCAEHGDVIIVNGLSDLNGKKIACVAGNNTEQLISEKILKAEIVLLETNEEAMAKLGNAEVAVAVLNRDFASNFIKGSAEFAISDVTFGDETLAIVVRAFDNKITEFWKLHDEVGADF